MRSASAANHLLAVPLAHATEEAIMGAIFGEDHLLFLYLKFTRHFDRFKSLEADALQAQMMLQPRSRRSEGTGGSSGAQTRTVSNE